MRIIYGNDKEPMAYWRDDNVIYHRLGYPLGYVSYPFFYAMNGTPLFYHRNGIIYNAMDNTRFGIYKGKHVFDRHGKYLAHIE